ncbi:MAG TPA: hypothetical protein VFS23_11115 [Vicinamibacterales bacterium]|nr:hypothetical protein [Vicinamibacterales bacterium]
MFRTCQTLDSFAADTCSRDGVAIEALPEGVTLVVKTQRSCYRVVVVDGSQRLVTVHGGAFPEPTTLRLCGATAGGSAVKVGWILVGLRMEFSVGPRRITSSTVHSVAFDPDQREEDFERVA